MNRVDTFSPEIQRFAAIVRSEYDDIVKWMARKGYSGQQGDPLPDLISNAVFQLIHSDLPEFRRRIRKATGVNQ